MRLVMLAAVALGLSTGLAAAQTRAPPSGSSGSGEAAGSYPPCSLKVLDRCTVQKGHMQIRKRTSRLTPLQRGQTAAASADAHPAAAAAYGTAAAPKGGPVTNPPAGGAH